MFQANSLLFLKKKINIIKCLDNNTASHFKKKKACKLIQPESNNKDLLFISNSFEVFKCPWKIFLFCKRTFVYRVL